MVRSLDGNGEPTDDPIDEPIWILKPNGTSYQDLGGWAQTAFRCPNATPSGYKSNAGICYWCARRMDFWRISMVQGTKEKPGVRKRNHPCDLNSSGRKEDNGCFTTYEVHHIWASCVNVPVPQADDPEAESCVDVFDDAASYLTSTTTETERTEYLQSARI